MPRIAAIALALFMILSLASAEGMRSSALPTSAASDSGAAVEITDNSEPTHAPVESLRPTAAASPEPETTEAADAADEGEQTSENLWTRIVRYWFIMPILTAIIVTVIIVTKKKPAPENITPAFEPSVSAVGNVHGIGKRSYQQDAFGMSDFSNKNLIKRNGVLSVLADGMGGLSKSDDISQAMVREAISVFGKESGTQREVLIKICANAVRCAKDQYSSGPNTGTTFIAASVVRGKLDFVSVGDSRIALIRGGSLITLNRAHNYGALLDVRAAINDVNIENAKTNPKRAALTSYLGMNDIENVDMPVTPVSLVSGDTIALMSDGVFGTLDDETIVECLKGDVYAGAENVNKALMKKAGAHQDNFTAILLRIS